jgi:alpha-galactosidase/6-phospho-beta-glucosidase family protein
LNAAGVEYGDTLLRAIVAHPLIHSVEAAESCMDELLALQADWLPQFGEGSTVALGGRQSSAVASGSGG